MIDEQEIDYMDPEVETGELLFHDYKTDVLMTLEAGEGLTNVEQSYDFTIYGPEDTGTLIKMDCKTGEVEFGENYTLDETARVFWQAIAMLNPALTQPVSDVEMEQEYEAMQGALDCGAGYAEDLAADLCSVQPIDPAREIANQIDSEVLQIIMDEHARRERFDHAMELLK